MGRAAQAIQPATLGGPAPQRDSAGSLAGATVVVTGVAGFLGSHAARMLLADGAVVVGLDRRHVHDGPERHRRNGDSPPAEGKFALHAEDVRAESARRLIRGADSVVHLAGIPGVRDAGPIYAEVNVGGTAAVARAACEAGVRRLLLASSSSVYGSSRTPLSEDSPLEPRSDYARSKLAAEQVARQICEGTRTELVVLRYFTVYGPGQRPDMLCHRLIEAALGRCQVAIYGDGSKARAFTYVDDAMRATRAALLRGRDGATYNVAGSELLSVRGMIDAVARAAGAAPSIVWRPSLDSDPSVLVPDLRRSRVTLGYRPQVSIEEGIAMQLAQARNGRRGGR